MSTASRQSCMLSAVWLERCSTKHNCDCPELQLTQTRGSVSSELTLSVDENTCTCTTETAKQEGILLHSCNKIKLNKKVNTSHVFSQYIIIMYNLKIHG